MIGHELEDAWNDTANELRLPSSARSKMSDALDGLKQYHRSTAEHSMRVGIMAVRIGRHIDLPLRPLFYGGSLHDRGKNCVPIEQLTKTTEWTPADAAILRSHPVDGYNQILAEGMVVTAGLVVRHHTFQAHSYPESIPEPPPYMTKDFMRCARIIALSDYYDAAHRSDSEALTSGKDIKDRVLSHGSDLTDLINDLYENGIFDTENRPF